MNTALAEALPVTADVNDFVIVPETTLPGGLVVPSFQVGRYACSKSDEGLAIVVADRKPWNRISYHESVEASKTAGFNLITETQYLAIAHQISLQDENWTGGKVGEGKIYQGLHLGTVYEPQDAQYESTNVNERRWHVLANGERIFDISGNLYSWVFDNVQGDENGVINREFAEDSPTKTTPQYEANTHGTGSSWVGNNWSGDALIRGGFWGDYRYAGVFYVYYDVPSGRSGYVGFRVTKSL